MILKEGEKRGQLTIFIIIAIFIIGGVVLFFIFNGGIPSAQVPASIQPLYNSFLTCLENDVSTGIDVLESQGGYVYLPEFEPGSNYMPFSSQLNFLGNPIPYWYYVSGNNLAKEQVPSKNEMEKHLADFIDERARDCDFSSYYDDGFEVVLTEPETSVSINDGRVDVSVSMSMSVVKGEDKAEIRTHRVSVDSELGSLYNTAKRIYDYENDNLFLENYAVDTLRLYAPVDGVELTCAPKTWNADNVFNDLKDAIEVNTLSLNLRTGLLSENENKYFANSIPGNYDVRFLTSANWPSTFEVNPSDGSFLIAKPVGNQPELGILGFCYVPYHYVYDVKYPVLIQVFSDNEIFQFPVAVVVQGNKPRNAVSESSAVSLDVPEICNQKNTEIAVRTFDTNLNSVETEISYQCGGTECLIGETASGFLEGEFPQCVNGFVVAKAEGFEETRQQHSVVNSGSVDVILDKLYEKEISMKLGGTDYQGNAIISFVSDKGSRTVVYPEQKTVELSEGQYEIEVRVYKDSSLRIGETSSQQCVDVPQTGLGGFFGLTKENCYTIDFPEQTIGNALAGGGKQSYYILESELQNPNAVEINAEELPIPNTIEQLQDNYLLIEDKNLEISFG
ncbi:MAG: hypothetical protein ABIH49_02635 [archaeon]